MSNPRGNLADMNASDLDLLDDYARGHVQVQTSGCWHWTSTLNIFGYGQVNRARRQFGVSAHRYVWGIVNGPIPKGMQLDHVCHNRDETCPGGNTCQHRKCVNPSHLRLATPRENTLASRGVTALNALKTHCPRGHELSPSARQRVCKTCARDRDEVRRRARGVAPGPKRGQPECVNGHAYTEENTYNRPDGKRVCRTCKRENDRRSEAARRAARINLTQAS